MQHLQQTDPRLYGFVLSETKRQQDGLEMIASENFVSPAVLEALGSPLTNKYAEGYPGKRYYGGCEFVDQVESLARERVCELFGAEYANVQPHSGSQANMAVYMSVLNPGDTVLGMSLAEGGHLTHGSPVNFSGKLYKFYSYGLNLQTGRIDYDLVRDLAKKYQPKLIVCGASSYPRQIDFSIFAEIAQEVGAKVLADIAHPAGLVATGLHPSPVPYCDFVTSTTHKTLRGPRGGLILAKETYAKSLDSKIFPGIQGGPLMHVIAAKAVGFHENLLPSYKDYCKQILVNTQVLAETLMNHGFSLVSGGSDNHLVLLDLTESELSGKVAEQALELAGITVNKNTVPGEKRSPFVTSGVRIGTPALTTRGFKEEQMQQVAHWICAVLREADNATLAAKIKGQIYELCNSFPLYAK